MLSPLICLVYLNPCISSIMGKRASHFTFNSSDIKVSDPKLRHIHVLFRHGDRSPVSSYPLSNKTFDELWPAGRGQLTDRGIEQEFQLGRWIRSKYPAFVPEVYNGSEYHMRSTDIDRTLMSAQAFTAGFYEHTDSPLQKFDISWKPIPVHTVEQKNDVLLSLDECPALGLLQNLQMDSNDSIEFEHNHQNVFNTLNRNLPGHSFDRYNVGGVVDAFICMRSHEMDLPVWYNPLKTELAEINRFYWVKKFASTPKIVRLEIGVFLHSMMKHLNAIVEGKASTTVNGYKLSTQHLMAYSAHDTDVTFLLAAFDVYDQKVIEYSSAVVFELLGPEPPAPASKFRFRIRYKRGWKDHDGEYLLPPYCKQFSVAEGCPLDVLMHGIMPMLLSYEEFHKICYAHVRHAEPFCRYSPDVHSSHVLYILTTVTAAVSILCLFSLVMAYRAHQRHKEIPFERFDPTI